MLYGQAIAQLPKLASGKLVRQEAFPSRWVAPRKVDVWLPDGYNADQRYPVLYMQDGQMLFDSTVTWNKKEWEADETLGRLFSSGKIKPFLLVAIWNTQEGRHADYMPQKPFESLPRTQQDSLYQGKRQSGASVFNGQKVRSDRYLKFLVEELKPFIDRTYSTLAGKSDTYIGGSSMGALISLYAICEYPQVFGSALCMSTHWPGIFVLENDPLPAAFMRYLEDRLPAARDHRIYFDHGDQTLDAWYPPLQKEVDRIIRKKGYKFGKSWITRYFKGEDHSETAWARRFNIPLEFLFRAK